MNNYIVWFTAIGLSVASLASNNVILIIFYLELVTLITLGLAYYNSNFSLYNGYNSLVSFFTISSVAGIIILIGWLLECYIFFFIGLSLKLGVFPFCWWVYSVYSGVSWEVLIYLNTLFKIPILVIALVILQNSDISVLSIMISFSVFFCIWYLISLGSSWISFIGGNSILSSALLLIFINVLNFNMLTIFLLLGWAYFISFIAAIYNNNSEGYLSGNAGIDTSVWWVLVLLSFPISVGIIYKLSSVYFFMSLETNFYLFFIWTFYQVVEQAWLVNIYFINSSLNLNSEEHISRLSL
uniref:NADH dehydrogenase subunit 2 n=1 Tax=Heterobothrium okamotoi TaxID=263722 RepID=A0A7U0M8A6_9PLAT|nr:NADH dehydrogenase subunit 2 [Heterobothrium okamotoi]QQX28227.1 NADH dehydrogenase subunit 2 [Heterobothrium okamotoi]